MAGEFFAEGGKDVAIKITPGTGGILQVFADVFGARVQTIDVSNSAALGAALRAAHACTDVDWPELFANFAAPAADIAVHPAETNAVYADLTERFLAELHTTYGV